MDKGCIYYHPPPPDSQPIMSSPSPSPPDYQSIQEPQAAYNPFGYSTESTDQMNTFYDDSQSQYSSYASDYDQGGVDIPFYSTPAPVYLREPLNYHLYTPTLPSVFVTSSTDSHFVPPSSELRQTLQSRSLNLPEELQEYHTLAPLDTVNASERRKFGNWYSAVYMAIKSTDGRAYALRRVENFRLMHQSAFSAIEAWGHIQHPSIVRVHEAFTTRAFNDSSLVVVYAYHPDAQTLYDVYLKSTSSLPFQPSRSQSFQSLDQAVVTAQPIHQPQFTPIPERTIWSYIVQIASAIKKVHEAKLAVRMIDTTKILVTGKNRIRIGSCGIVDVLMHDSHQDMHLLQLEDLTMFGRLIFALCCNNASATTNGNFQKSLEVMSRLYSPEIKTLALFLISKNHPNKNINAVYEMIGTKIFTELDDALIATDKLENELLSELENARLVRLLCKFGFINERPEFARDPRWSETGDRYIIKLFRDYVFHQSDEHGNPVTNLSHVLSCLSKLDAGTDEKVMLVARDEQSCLVVSYKEIKACIDAAFSDLSRAGR
ncbi:hypothetical protein D9758_007902 [Tetrapyrgos nigripes]|uniref:PAN2-PAN3 deadenylation complex subunit PAN3 n=1 Tax=Tetrapyrgos nigripes TaxID=182062 RepID=A0A8H5FY04_9AGAR|nr:hypothetical protein D9758_007902 [Tetrapyrgos nigripes]